MSGEPQHLQAEIDRLRQENAELRQRLGVVVAEPQAAYASATPELPLVAPPPPQIANASPVQDKIKLFRSLFRGRDDVYAERWVSDRTGKKGYSPACENRWSQDKSEPRKYLPLTDQVVHEAALSSQPGEGLRESGGHHLSAGTELVGDSSPFVRETTLITEG